MKTKNDVVPPIGFSRFQILQPDAPPIIGIAWSPDGEKIASLSEDGGVRVWDARNGVRLWEDALSEGGYKASVSKFGNIGWVMGGHALVAGLNEELSAWQTHNGKRMWKKTVDPMVVHFHCSPDGTQIALGCMQGVIRIINSKDAGEIRIWQTELSPVTSVAWSPDGKWLASSNYDVGLLSVWNPSTWKLTAKLKSSSSIWNVTWSTSAKIIAAGSEDATIKMWNARTRKQESILEGHTESVMEVSFSFDNRFFASRSESDVRLWQADENKLIAMLPRGTHGISRGLAFHPVTSKLASVGADRNSIDIWDIDVRTMGQIPTSPPVRYTNAKIVLVGDSGVGKSGLALVLTGKPWAETGSTHGRHVWVLDSHEVENNKGLKETREVLLWDLAGQPDYRLIHQLHLTEVAIALVVFDSRSQTDPFAGVHHWDRAIRQVQRVQPESIPATQKYLVAARVDVGRIGASLDRIQSVRLDLNFDRYFETSAKEGWGIKELLDAIRNGIDWDALPTVSSTELFQNIKAFLVKEKESGRLLSSIDDLYRAYLKTTNTDETEDLRAQFETCIGRVESRGLIQRLSFGNLILLQPELQDVYASAITNAVKDDPDGLGCIKEEKARAGQFRMPADERIEDPQQEKLLLISTVEDLLRHEIALREQGEDGQYLVFPSQLTRENPDLPDPEGKAVIFNFEGPVLNIYATLAVRLSYSGFFKKKEMWKNAATYSTPGGGTCGMFLREVNEGRGELTLFFDPETTEESRFQFEEYIRVHLERKALPESIHRRRIFVCHECGTPVLDVAAKRRRERGYDWIPCNVCEPAVRISLLDREERVKADRVANISEIDRAVEAQREIQTAASVIQGKIATSDFDVFLCYNSEDKAAVKKIGELLKERGLLPWLDEWELQPGIPCQPELEKQIEKIKSAAVFVGEDGIGPWQQRELDAFLREFVSRKCPVIPVVLDNAPKKPALPVFLKGMTWVDFRKSEPDPLNQLIWGITGKRDFGREYERLTLLK